jgi:hypothetical protein
VTEAEIRAAFAPDHGFDVRAVVPAKFTTNLHQDGGHAWRATIERAGG